MRLARLESYRERMLAASTRREVRQIVRACSSREARRNSLRLRTRGVRKPVHYAKVRTVAHLPDTRKRNQLLYKI